MAKTKDPKPFKFELTHLLRITIFVVLVYLLISFFSTKNINKTNTPFDTSIVNSLFTPLINKIPAETIEKFNKIPQTPAVLGVTNTIDTIRHNLDGFPSKQINNFKKDIFTQIYQSIIKDIDD